MVIFLQDDQAYRSWAAHHRRGFVLDGRWKPKIGHLVLHRAVCPEIRGHDRRSHWTTGGRFKAGSLTRDDLLAWADDETGRTADHCPLCRPGDDPPNLVTPSALLPHLAAEILEYVLDAAVIHLEPENPPYRLTVADVASCFAKTAGQLAPALYRLAEEGYLESGEGTLDLREAASSPRSKRPIRLLGQTAVYPTMLALRTLAAFHDASDDVLRAELAKLHGEEPVSDASAE